MQLPKRQAFEAHTVPHYSMLFAGNTFMYTSAAK